VEPDQVGHRRERRRRVLLAHRDPVTRRRVRGAALLAEPVLDLVLAQPVAHRHDVHRARGDEERVRERGQRLGLGGGRGGGRLRLAAAHDHLAAAVRADEHARPVLLAAIPAGPDRLGGGVVAHALGSLTTTIIGPP
jgi:hypothetical protein